MNSIKHHAINRTGWCCVPKCSTNSKKNTEKNCGFYRFPKDPERSLEWVLNSGRKDLLLKDAAFRFSNYRVCGIHFEKTMYHSLLTKKLKKDAVPTIFGEAASSPQPPMAKKQKLSEVHHLMIPHTAASTSAAEITESSLPTYLPDPLSISASIKQEDVPTDSDSTLIELTPPPAFDDPLLLPENADEGAIASDSYILVNESLPSPSSEDPLLLPASIEEQNTVGYLSNEVKQNCEPQWAELSIVKQEPLTINNCVTTTI